MKRLSIITGFYFLLFSSYSQDENKYKISLVGFYNVENLFDTIVDPDTNKILQDDFTPIGKKRWNTPKYLEKLDNLSKVISEMGLKISPDGLAAFGVAEVENREVLEDLIATEKLKDRNYQIVHYDSPDRRGIDVGFIYNPKYFTVTNSKDVPLIRKDREYKSRSQLVVSGLLDGEPMHFIVAHWPSRRGGEKKSLPGRIAAAELGRSLIDSLLAIDPQAKVIYMGDLNDDPNNESVRKYLKGVSDKEKINEGDMYNPFENFHSKGIGSLAWRDVWNLFDQILLTPAFIDPTYSSWSYYGAKVFNKEYLKQQSGRFKGYPYRSYVGDKYVGGYSDHFPTYVYLIKKID